MRVIILAAGHSQEIDGINKILLKDVKSGKTILDHYLDFFAKDEVTIVVGYNSTSIIMCHPELNYIYNPDWRITGNSYSLGLALSDSPCVILSSDFFMDQGIITGLKATENGNIVATRNSANRSRQALNCVLSNGNVISAIYQGPMKQDTPEVVGIFTFSNDRLLRKLKENCLKHPNLLVGQNIPLDIVPVVTLNIDSFSFNEINTPIDYINFIQGF
jgi:choline kinase